MDHPMLSVRVLELLSSRMCHELISPVGAVVNGVELFEEMGIDAAQDAVGLISQSAHSASRRLAMLRLVYGAAGSDATIVLAQVQTVVKNYFDGSKISFNWKPLNPSGAFDETTFFAKRGYVKIILNAILMTAEALSQKGVITVKSEEDDDIPVIHIAGERDGLEVRPEIIESLKNAVPVDQLDPRTVHAHVAHLFAQHFGFDLSYTITPGQSCVLTIRPL